MKKSNNKIIISITDKILLETAKKAMTKAYAPYSRFRVGSAILTANDKIFTGCNVENASYGLTICAERSAVVSAVSAGERRFKAVAIIVSGKKPACPCGACLQMLGEFAATDMKILMASFGNLKAVKTARLSELMPCQFRLKK